jgi:hypothetical protein
VYRTPFDVRSLRLLAESYPEALLVRDDYGYLPVHLVARNVRMLPGDEDAPRFASRVFQYLVAQFPTAAQLVTPAGQRLIHLALAEWDWVSVADIRFLLRHSPDSIRARNLDKDLPLHVTVQAGRVEVVRFLVQQRPRFVRKRGGRGRLPAHVAAARVFNCACPSYAILVAFTSHWSKRSQVDDDHGGRPRSRCGASSGC